jgi:hypothetical protein
MATSTRSPGQKELKVRVDRAQHAELTAKAHAVGMTLSAWLRQQLGLPKLAETRGRKKTGRKPASERKRNDTKERGVGKGNYTRKPRAPRMVQAPLFPPDAETPPPASSPSSAPVKGATSSPPATTSAA